MSEVWRNLARVVTWLAAALLGVFLVGQPGGWAEPVSTSPLSLSGDVSGLQPGGTGTLRLTVRNPADRPVTVGRLTAILERDDGCLTLPPWTGRLVVPAHGQAHADLAVTVRAHPGCNGQSWRLLYRAG